MQEKEMSLAEAHKVHRNFMVLAAITVFVIATGAIVMHYLEQLTWVNSFYFAVVSLLTVGYGDIVPTTDPGKIFVCFYLLVGVGILATFASNLVRNAVARRVINKSESRK